MCDADLSFNVLRHGGVQYYVGIHLRSNKISVIKINLKSYFLSSYMFICDILYRTSCIYKFCIYIL